MAKALELNGDALAAAPPVPRAAQVNPPPVPEHEVKARSKPAKAKAKADIQVPLQVRWPRSEVKAAKLAAVQGDYQSVSEFMLACFHAYMKSRKAE